MGGFRRLLLQGRLAERGIAGDLSGRPKNLWGVAAKMRAKGRGVEQVYDVRALRVVVPSKADCYAVLREVRPCCDTCVSTPYLLILVTVIPRGCRTEAWHGCRRTWMYLTQQGGFDLEHCSATADA